MNSLESMHPDLAKAQTILYMPHHLQISNLIPLEESKEYGACTFTLNEKKIIFRAAKITPTKIGQFVTLWKRNNNGPIAPLDISDQFDIVIVSCRQEDQLGQFIFPKEILMKHGVISSPDHEGKRALRIYPPWSKPTSKQAVHSQKWQLAHFIAIHPVVHHTSSIQRAIKPLLT